MEIKDNEWNLNSLHVRKHIMAEIIETFLPQTVEASRLYNSNFKMLKE